MPLVDPIGLSGAEVTQFITRQRYFKVKTNLALALNLGRNADSAGAFRSDSTDHSPGLDTGNG